MSQPDDVFDPEPEAPEPPADGACCGSGCDNCVLDVYQGSALGLPAQALAVDAAANGL